MAYIMSTIGAYFRTHHGNETRTYFGIFFSFSRTYKSSAVKKHVPWKAPLIRNAKQSLNFIQNLCLRAVFTKTTSDAHMPKWYSPLS